LAWVKSGPGLAEFLTQLRNFIEASAPNKLEEFDATFPGLHPTDAETEEDIYPYQGLEAFTPETRQFFYGRQDTVDLLVQKLETFNFVPVIGPSGSGKSSVVRAGLVPTLEASGWRVLEPIKPRMTPMASLELAISTLFQRATDIKKALRLLQQQGLPPILEMLTAAPATARAKTLLVIDQFEEVFTLCAIESERSRFIDCITAVQTQENSPLAIVTTMRADFVEPWLDYGDLVQTIQNQAVWLGRLQGENLRQAIEQPAKDLGYRFSDGLLDFILRDVQEEKNCLPLLEFALTELWEQRNRQNKELSLTTYTTMQGLKGALNKRAEEVYNDDLTTDEERTWAKRLCLELVRIGPDIKDTRQPQPRENLLALAKTESNQDVLEEVIEALVEGTAASDRPALTPGPSPNGERGSD
jgi:energy-coupling factor transporter ATP-binding protein EcfA2